jgi:antitoxin VapB
MREYLCYSAYNKVTHTHTKEVIMTLSIRDAETDSMARELASITGESITDAVGKALEERLSKVRRNSNIEVRKARINELLAIANESMISAPLSDDDLYDEYGLPREDR